MPSKSWYATRSCSCAEQKSSIDSPAALHATALPAVVCTCITQCASPMPPWIAECSVKPAGFTRRDEPSTTRTVARLWISSVRPSIAETRQQAAS
jgi:hypothetical protein